MSELVSDSSRIEQLAGMDVFNLIGKGTQVDVFQTLMTEVLEADASNLSGDLQTVASWMVWIAQFEMNDKLVRLIVLEDGGLEKLPLESKVDDSPWLS